VSSIATLLQWQRASAVEIGLVTQLTDKFATIHTPHSVSLMLFKNEAKILVLAYQ